MGMRIAFHHLAHELDDLQRVSIRLTCQATYSGGYWSASRRPSDRNTYSGESFMPLLPVFQIDVHCHILLVGVIHYGQNILDMLFGSLLQLVGAMLQRAFAAGLMTRQPVAYTSPPTCGSSTKPNTSLGSRLRRCRPVTNHFAHRKLSFRIPAQKPPPPDLPSVPPVTNGQSSSFSWGTETPAGLFTVAERSVHDFSSSDDNGVVYSPDFYHLYSPWKIDVIKPFIRQCFL